MSSFVAFDSDGLVRLELNGWLDSAGVDQMEQPLIESVDRGRKNVLIDPQRAGRALMLTGAQAQVVEVFETVSLGEGRNDV